MSMTKKMKWVEYIDEITGEPDSVELEPKDKIDISIYRCIGNRWFVTIRNLEIYAYNLKTQSIEEAKKRAIAFARKNVEQRISDLRLMYDALNNVEGGQ